MAQEVDVGGKKPAYEEMSENVSRKLMPTTFNMLYIANTVSGCQTLGPGKRGVVWVSGCSRKCPGCIAAPIQDIRSGILINIGQLAEEILSWNNIEGITLSGGEPFEQAGALADLCDIIRKRSQLSIISYSGFTFAELKSSTDSGQQRLLQHLDVLIDGPFIRSLQADLLWRGSSNQQVLFLKDTYRDWAPFANCPGAGIEIHISKEGLVSWVGVPEAGFAKNLESVLANADIRLIDKKRAWI